MKPMYGLAWKNSSVTQTVMHAGSALSSAGQQVPKTGCSLLLAWLNASKSGIGAFFILALVVYAVFFPHPERGPREIAAEIMPSQTRVNGFKGESRDIPGWQELHKQYVEEIKLKVARKEVRTVYISTGLAVQGLAYHYTFPEPPWEEDVLRV